MDWRPRIDETTAPAMLVVLVASAYAAVLPAAIFGLKYLYSIPMVLGTLFPLALYTSRNPRLFFLIGMVFTAPLGLSINFRGHPHMGGAFAFSITLMDFFMVPLIGFLVHDYIKGRRAEFKFSTVSAWWACLMVLGLVSVVIGPFRQQAAFEVVRMLHLWVIFLVIVNECVREKHFHYVLVAMLANIALNCAVATGEYLLKRDLGLQPLGEASPESMLGADFGVYGKLGEVFRPGGLAGHTNLFSAYLALTMPIFIAMLYTDHSKTMKAVIAVVLPWAAVMLGLTLSRSGWASFAVALLLLTIALFWLREVRKKYKLLKAAMLAAMIAGGIAGSGLIIRRLTRSDSGALDFRWEWVHIAWQMVMDRPVWGFGLNSFVYHLEDYAPYSPQRMFELFGDMLPAVHNTYMLVWSEQGTVGLFFFIGMNAAILGYAVRNLAFRGLSQKVYMTSIGAACGVVAIMVDGLASFYLRVPAPARTFFIVMGLVVAAYYWNVRNRDFRERLAASASAPPPGEAPPPSPETPSPRPGTSSPQPAMGD
jgi:putative inorganic carbon (hco3(-)) transporter